MAIVLKMRLKSSKEEEVLKKKSRDKTKEVPVSRMKLKGNKEDQVLKMKLIDKTDIILKMNLGDNKVKNKKEVLV